MDSGSAHASHGATGRPTLEGAVSPPLEGEVQPGHYPTNTVRSPVPGPKPVLFGDPHLGSVEAVHKLVGSAGIKVSKDSDVPDPNIMLAISGTGLAPWEIHRPQKFVCELVLRRAFSGRVLDAGCGIGDNALYIAKACPGTSVVAVDKLPRCLDFAATKAGLRGMRSAVQLIAADLAAPDPGLLPAELRSAAPFDSVLDSCLFHDLDDTDRARYMAVLRQLLRPGGVLHLAAMSEEETHEGGARRISESCVRGTFNASSGWEVEGAEDILIETHPTFWGGKARGRAYTVRRL